MSLMLKESVADRVRKFKENNHRKQPNENSIRINDSISNLVMKSNVMADPVLRKPGDDNLDMSSCSSIEDIFAVLRARATESVDEIRTSYDLSDILQEIRSSTSEVSVTRARTEPCDFGTPENIRELLKRINADIAPVPEDDDPAAVIARIKERLRGSDSKIPRICSIVQDSSVCITGPGRPLKTVYAPTLQIPGQGDKTLVDRASQRAPEKSYLSMVTVSVLQNCGAESTDESTVSNPVDHAYIPSLPLDPDWGALVEAEIWKTREAIYSRIKQERESH